MKRVYLAALMAFTAVTPVCANIEVALTYRAPEMTAPVTVDGKLDEWAAVEPLILTSAAHWEPARSGETYGGPKDCAARVYLAWDRDHLYLAVEAYDDDLAPPTEGAKMLDGDCIVIAVDPRDDGGQGYREDDCEFGFAYSVRGALAWRWFPSERAGPLDAAKVAVVREVKPGALAEGVPPIKLTYEIAIPWSELPGPSGVEGKILGFDLAIADVDGGRRHGWLQWTPGMMGIKDPSRFGSIKLVGPALPPPEKPPTPD